MNIERAATNQLIKWKNNSHRSPLLVRGARQVGKTHLIEHFGKSHFKNLVVINFEFLPECIPDFDSLNPETIISRLQIKTKKTIDPKNTLLFLDEIQECPNAIMAMRYFKEKMPALAVVGAGSLLEFLLNDTDFELPVGRVDFLYLYPLSFSEFLKARGEEHFLNWCESTSYTEQPVTSIHQKGLSLIREYCLIGGMPEVLTHYISHPADVSGTAQIQSKLIQSYNLDFGKYARNNNQHKHLQTVYQSLRHFVGKQVTYSKLAPEMLTRDCKAALNLLRLAGLCHFITGSSGAGIPLSANANHKKLKLSMIDTGLYLRSMKLDVEVIDQPDLQLINQGTLSEQLVAQGLISCHPNFEEAELYFWAKDKRGSSAEVDYLWQSGEKIIPIEVKSTASNHLKSLNLFMTQYHSPFGVRICSEPLMQIDRQILSMPFYLLEQLPRLLKEFK